MDSLLQDVGTVRPIIHRTSGQTHGPITRLASPGDLGGLIKPFVFLDLFDNGGREFAGFGLHPHSGIATLTYLAEGSASYEDTTGARGVLAAGGVEWMQAGGGVWHGAGAGKPRLETDPLLPLSPYAASKVGAETAALETWRRTGLRVVLGRPFPHTGPGQTTQFVVPAFAARLRAARRSGARTVATGNLGPVRDLLDVRDVVAAYRLLLARGTPGEAYNVASGAGLSLAEVRQRRIRPGQRLLDDVGGVELPPEAAVEVQLRQHLEVLTERLQGLRLTSGHPRSPPMF